MNAGELPEVKVRFGRALQGPQFEGDYLQFLLPK